MSTPRHFDEAQALARDAFLGWTKRVNTGGGRQLLIDDVLGRISIALWSPFPKKAALKLLDDEMKGAAGPFWSGSVYRVTSAEGSAWERMWESAVFLDRESRNLKVLEKPLSRLHWFDPPRPIESKPKDTRTIAFLSFKGGVGRTTALAAFAIQRARSGENVAVLDLDLDAPGVGRLLSDDAPRAQAPYGVVDFLLEAPWIDDIDLNEYVHRCARPQVTETGSISVIPAGTLNDNYLPKIARVELNSELEGPGARYGFSALLEKTRNMAPRPAWILIDGRAGLSEAAGLLLSGIADLHVIVATASEQSYDGLALTIEHIGARRLRSGDETTQAEVLIAQSMIPDDSVVGRLVQERFEERLEDIFRARYYAKDPDTDEDRWWSLADMDSLEAPHRPVPLGYKGRFVSFERIDEIADDLVNERDYAALGDRILGVFGAATPDMEDPGDETDE
ncbi:MAG: P-loop NTPase [Deltaproteobacteria bacterium]|nr:P-loop NTPase [Deltaproteobacteria bacterium]